MCWVYKWDSASSRYQVGYYNSGTFVAIESHTNRSDAANSVNYLNGGIVLAERYRERIKFDRWHMSSLQAIKK